jgi:hypothetical protein
MTMRLLTLTNPAMLMMGTLLTGVGAEAAPTVGHLKSVEQVTETAVNPCNGEEIVLSGEAVLRVTQLDDWHVEFFTSAKSTGTGQESGATYTSRLEQHEIIHWSADDDKHANFVAGAAARTTSDPLGLGFTSHFVFHGVLLPSGEFKVTRSLDRVECKG